MCTLSFAPFFSSPKSCSCSETQKCLFIQCFFLIMLIRYPLKVLEGAFVNVCFPSERVLPLSITVFRCVLRKGPCGRRELGHNCLSENQAVRWERKRKEKTLCWKSVTQILTVVMLLRGAGEMVVRETKIKLEACQYRCMLIMKGGPSHNTRETTSFVIFAYS